jgi:eukaryotic-like serine/threonine-protein kinase
VTSRRTVVLILLAGACFAALAASLGIIRTSTWWLKTVTAGGAASAVFAVGIVQAWAGKAMDGVGQPRTAPTPLADSILTLSGKAPLVRAVTNPVTIGVRSVPAPAGGTLVPPYVPRDIDDALRSALGTPGFVLVVGDAAAGKTRTAYEAMRAVLPGHALIAPIWDGGDIPQALSAARAERRCVLWLDNLQRYIGAGAITDSRIAELLADGGHHRVVLATLRATEETRLMAMAGGLPTGQRTRDGQAVLDQVTHRIMVDRLFSEPERARAAELARDDRSLADALGHADRYGIAEFLSSGPRLNTEWLDGWERGSHPRGAALIAAAVDCRRAGYAAPLPRVLLDELHEQYLERHGGARLRPESLEAAWMWATKLRDGGNSPLWPAGQGRCEVFDYLVDVTERESSQLVADQTVHVALRHAQPGDAVSIAATAWYQERPDLAEAGFRTAYTELRDTKGPDAPATLSSRSDLAVVLHAMGRLPDAEAEYRAILATRTAALGATHPDTLSSRNNLAVVLHAQRRLSEAEAEYREVLDIRARTLGREHPDTLTSRNNLGVALLDLGRIDEAETQLEEAARLRAQALGAEHPHTIISLDNLRSLRRRRIGR